MSCNSNNQNAGVAGATAGVGPNPDKVTKAFLVGYSATTMCPVFAEATIKGNGTPSLPSMHDSQDGLRFVGRDGQEHTHYIPAMTPLLCRRKGRDQEVLYDVDVIWAPKGIDKSQLTRDRDGQGPVEEALENFLRSSGAQPSTAVAPNIAYR
ncbi:hypothetical protein ONZ43_g3843 [Nemania bipapillata]|uniref:Uncharacterized protein n=1 Tax=Nemania bipapillata TaxID=110536 RepID=A0ACC2IVC8_9PEZI|nr:hypothetical protein ONZ43_g3843 [Nemania bipapillata]